MHAIEAPAEPAILFESPLVRVMTIGRGQTPATCPSKPCCLAFHRTAVGIQPADGLPFVGNPNFVTLHDPDRPSLPFDIDARGGRSDWFCIDPSLLPEGVAL